jgi:hypothetical protein
LSWLYSPQSIENATLPSPKPVDPSRHRAYSGPVFRPNQGFPTVLSFPGSHPTEAKTTVADYSTLPAPARAKFPRTPDGVVANETPMNLRNLVDAIRRKPASEASAAPKAAEDPSSPATVEVADVVTSADASLAPRTSPIVQSLLGGFATAEHRLPRHSGPLPALPPPGDAPVVPPPGISPQSPPQNPFAEFEAVNRVLSNGASEVPEQPPVQQPPPNTWFDVSLSTRSGEQEPVPDVPSFPSFPPASFESPAAAFEPPTFEPASFQPAPPQPLPPAPPVRTPTPAVLTPPPLPTPPQLAPPAMEAPALPDAFPIFIHQLNQAASADDVLRELAQAALECLDADRAFLVPISSEGQPGPIDIVFGENGHLLQGLRLTTEFVSRMVSHANLFADPNLIEMSPGLSLLPPEHFMSAESYLLTGGPPWPGIVGLQWKTPPSETKRVWAKTLVNCARLALQRLAATALPPVSLPRTPTQPLPAPPAVATRSGLLAEAMFVKLNEALILLDNDGMIHAVNPMAEYALNCLSADAVGRRLFEIGRKNGGTNVELWEHLATSAEEQQFSAELHLADGLVMTTTVVVVDVPAQAPAWSGGRAIAIRDVSHVRAEITQAFEETLDHHTQAAQAAASALLVTEEELSRMRTSLQMVLGFSELLHRGEYGAMNPQQFEMFRNIEHHAKELAVMMGLSVST